LKKSKRCLPSQISQKAQEANFGEIPFINFIKNHTIQRLSGLDRFENINRKT